MKYKKFFSPWHICILMLLIFCLQSCSNDTTSAFRINICTDPTTLDPRQTNDVVSSNIVCMLFEGLTRIDNTGNTVLAAATDYSVSSDGKVYSFTLRDAISAQDFADGWKSSLNPTFPSCRAHLLYIVKNARDIKKGNKDLDSLGIKVINKTLKITLEHPCHYFLELLSSPAYFPLKPNGPFKLTHWKHGQTIILTKNENYWDTNNIHIPEINMCMVENASTELHMFENRELDWMGAPFSHIPVDAIPQLKESNQIITTPVRGVYWYKFNTKAIPFNNVKMRRAFALAIDSQDIVDHILQTTHIPAMEANYSLAKQLFEEALIEMDISRNDLSEILLSYNTTDNHHKIAQTIQQQWQNTFDIEIGLDNSEWLVHLYKINNHNYQIGRIAWLADYDDPMAFLELYKYTNVNNGGGNNDTYWENKLFQELLSEAEKTNDKIEYNKLIKQAETLFLQEMPVTPLFYFSHEHLQSSQIEGAFINKLGRLELRWAKLQTLK
jgi:oligopeptide transport system substrate-binding protein